MGEMQGCRRALWWCEESWILTEVMRLRGWILSRIPRTDSTDLQYYTKQPPPPPSEPSHPTFLLLHKQIQTHGFFQEQIFYLGSKTSKVLSIYNLGGISFLCSLNGIIWWFIRILNLLKWSSNLLHFNYTFIIIRVYYEE